MCRTHEHIRYRENNHYIDSNLKLKPAGQIDPS